jgi:hypothetical protein
METLEPQQTPQQHSSRLDPTKSHSYVEVFLDSPMQEISKGVVVVTEYVQKILGKFAVNPDQRD